MVASNTSTVLYLWRHVKRMEDSSSSSALHYQKQKRVAILSIIQTLLFFISSAWLMAYEIIFRLNVYYFDLSGHILFSIVGFYSCGTTIILSVGQTKFRVRVVEIGENWSDYLTKERPESLQKPPLNVLLGSLIGCNLIINIVNLFFMADAVPMPEWIYIILRVAAFYAVRASFADCLGLNVFYYFQIVPARRPFLIWVKMHIKLLMYLMLFFANIYTLFGLLWKVLLSQCNSSVVYYNLSTSWNNTTDYQEGYYHESTSTHYQNCHEERYALITEITLMFVYSLVGFVIMVASNTSTVLYLWRHVRRMEDSSSFSALYYQKQKRVTILSIIQTVLFFIYSLFLIVYEACIIGMNLLRDNPHCIVFSVVAFYSLGTTIILGIAQTKFRVRAVEILKKREKTCYCCYSNTENG
ncbi:uncharacterized protein [Misgurnus anguillicaudatus]|uniref:uncharacterized protein n=1 Tax=Misgurnus anguillicaudatus TaxID=75329 RepID=UPI003CCF3E89